MVWSPFFIAATTVASAFFVTLLVHYFAGATLYLIDSIPAKLVFLVFVFVLVMNLALLVLRVVIGHSTRRLIRSSIVAVTSVIYFFLLAPIGINAAEKLSGTFNFSIERWEKNSSGEVSGEGYRGDGAIEPSVGMSGMISGHDYFFQNAFLIVLTYVFFILCAIVIDAIVQQNDRHRPWIGPS